VDKIKRVKHIDSPYTDIQTQIDKKTNIVELLVSNADIDNYDLSAMIPKVTYDDWIVCSYKDGKLYRIDEEDIIEVTPIEVLEYNKNFEVRKPNGKVMSDEELFEYCDCLCCGEADDMSCYVYFE
jgi:hypothetical protein